MGFDITATVRISVDMWDIIQLLATKYPCHQEITDETVETFDWSIERKFLITGIIPDELKLDAEHSIRPEDFPLILKIFMEGEPVDGESMDEIFINCFDHEGSVDWTNHGNGCVDIDIGSYSSYKGSEPLDIDHEKIVEILHLWRKVDGGAATSTVCSLD